MKRKSLLRLGAIASLVLTAGVAIGIATSVMGHNGGLRLRATDHDANCHWNHYEAVAATYESHGSKEFWACCTHAGMHSLDEPAEGHITDMGPFSGEFFDDLDPLDDRYVPMLTGGNKFARLDVIGWQDPAILYTSEQYTAVTGVSMKLRVQGEYAAYSGNWISVNVSSGHNNWTSGVNIATSGNTYFTDGEWHLVHVDIGPATGYVNFCYNLDHPMSGSIDIDDFTVETATGTHCETFESNTMMEFDANHVRISAEANNNRFLREDSINAEDEQASVHTSKMFTAVTNISYKMRIPSGCGAWGNVSVANNNGIYTDTTTAWTADGEWHLYSKDFASVDGYVKFGHEQGHFTGPIDIDDVVITYDGGKVAIDTFDGESIFMTYKLDKAIVTSEERGKAVGVVALDASISSVKAKAYSPTFDQSKGVDATYGSYIQLDNWQCKNTEDRCWVVLNATESLSLIQHRLGGEVGSYYFYMYNPLDENFQLNIILNSSYVTAKAFTLAPKEWTKISMDVGTYGGETLTTPEQMGLDHTFGSAGALVGSGWKISSIYAAKPADKFLRLYSSTYSSGTATAYTTVEYADITSISFDYRLIGSPQAGKGAWWGVGVAANHDIYTGMHTTSTAAWDGEWHSKTVDLSGSPESGFINLIHACGEQEAGSTIDFDNIVITYDGGKTVTEDFNSGFSVFTDYTGHDSRWALLER